MNDPGRQYRNRDWMLFLVILLVGLVAMLGTGTLASSLAPQWNVHASIDSKLDPNRQYATLQSTIVVIEPVSADILTPPAWQDIFLTPQNTFTHMPAITPTSATPTIPTITITPLHTPNPTELIEQAFGTVDWQFQNTMKSNAVFNAPSEMHQDETGSILLILNPSMSATELAGQLATQVSLATSTAEAGQLVDPDGRRVSIETSEVEITPLMRAVLKAYDADAFAIQEMHDNAEQVVGLATTTTWHWSVTAKKEGRQILQVILYRLIKYDDEDHWHDVETYRANIIVQVSVGSWLKSLDWQWVASTLLIPIAWGIWAWLRNRKKKSEDEKPVRVSKKGKRTKGDSKKN